jgi:hypothetical protein
MRRVTRVMSYVAVAVVAGVAGAVVAMVVTDSDDGSALPGYRLTSKQQTVVRVFDDGMPQVIYEFPATMNGCAQGRFVVRWRTLHPDVTVTFAPVYGGTGPDDLVPVEDSQPETGTSGKWVSDTQCEQPAWALEDVGDRASTLVDITVEYEVWTATP